MDRIDHSTATEANQFTEGNPAQGVPATVVTAAWLNSVQEELLAVIEAAGLTPDSANLGQLLEAIAAMGQDIGAASTAEAGIVELLTDPEALSGTDAARAATAANIKAVLGARGLWKDAVYVPAPMDWDNLLEPGVYRPNAASGNLNAPPSGANTWYIVLVLRAASTSLLQIAWPMAATNIPRIHVRKFVGDWMPWETIYTDYNGIVSSVGTRTTTGTWTLTGLTIGRPVYLVMTSTYTAAIDISYLVLSGAANLSSTVAASQHFVGQRGNSASPPNVGVIIPTATSVEISVVTISIDTTLMAYQ